MLMALPHSRAWRHLIVSPVGAIDSGTEVLSLGSRLSSMLVDENIFSPALLCSTHPHPGFRVGLFPKHRHRGTSVLCREGA